MTVTFDGAPKADHINFGVGQPSMDLLPVELIKKASDGFLAQAQSAEINYGPLKGDARTLEALANFLSSHYETSVHQDNLMLTGGNSQALDFLSSQLITTGDVVFVEEPSYFLAFQIFKDHGAKLVGIPVDDEGINIEFLESALAYQKPKLLYTIPCFHNPCGHTLTVKRRERLVELAKRHDFIVVADEPYHLLRYQENSPPPMGDFWQDDVVISMGSFSKILAPGMRLGWLQTSPNILKQLLSSGVLNSGGSFNHFGGHIIRHAMSGELLEQHLRHTKAALAERVDAMDEALHQHMSDLCSWRKPKGGYFFWLQLAAGIDTRDLRKVAIEHKTGFQPGPVFSSNQGLENFLRLSFAHYGCDEIETGVQRLATALRKHVAGS
ncbi:MAG: PLP-dependent aminotransferase family protein [Pseudomonadota bacterium]